MEIIGHYSNTHNLLTHLRRTIEAVTTMITEDDQPDITPPGQAWRIRNRLSPADLNQLVDSFRQGTTIAELTARYGISRTSIRAILRKRGTWRHPKHRPTS